MISFPRQLHRAASLAVLAALLLAASSSLVGAQLPSLPSPEAELAEVPLSEPAVEALPLAEDRGAADLEQTLKRLGTTASVLVIVAHPDDEDGALMTYLSRGLGVRVTLLTLTRGEGGQNAMSAESYDALGLIRTNELLKADEYYGARQLWGTEADFGFSKTQEESFAKWGHDRVLYDAVLAVRMVRPQVILSTFVGGPSDGHGHHQVSGEIAQEAFKVAGDPKVFPEQLKNGLQPWQPLAVYSRAPFARIENGQMFDYATGKWAPARFHNYVTGEWTEGAPKADVTIPVGTWDPVARPHLCADCARGLGQADVAVRRRQSRAERARLVELSPVGRRAHSCRDVGASSKCKDMRASSENAQGQYRHQHRRPGASGRRRAARMAHRWPGQNPIRSQRLHQSDCRNQGGVDGAHKLVPIYRETLDLYARVKASDLDAKAKVRSRSSSSAKRSTNSKPHSRISSGSTLLAFTSRSRRQAGRSRPRRIGR